MPYNPVRLLLLLASFYWWGNWSTEVILPKVTQVIIMSRVSLSALSFYTLSLHNYIYPINYLFLWFWFSIFVPDDQSIKQALGHIHSDLSSQPVIFLKCNSDHFTHLLKNLQSLVPWNSLNSYPSSQCTESDSYFSLVSQYLPPLSKFQPYKTTVVPHKRHVFSQLCPTLPLLLWLFTSTGPLILDILHVVSFRNPPLSYPLTLPHPKMRNECPSNIFPHYYSYYNTITLYCNCLLQDVRSTSRHWAIFTVECGMS